MIQKGCRHFIQNGKTQNFAHCVYSRLTCLSVHINYVLIMKRSILSLVFIISVMPHYATFRGMGGKHYIHIHYINKLYIEFDILLALS